jgi:eukaryotic-like serine/threonine-protein kinase
VLSAGTRLGPYEILAKLGEGGMGMVYRARDTRLGRDVALKFLPPEFAQDPDRRARFEREARLLASLNHPHIATLFGVDEADGRHILAMELVEGADLAQRLEHGPIPVEEAIAIALQIAEALEAAHEKGIVHRDLKPANVKVRPDGTVKVLDFGLAKAWESDTSATSMSLSPTITQHQTQAGIILGTAAYMAPEQAAGMAADARADVWAFGVVLYEMLTGRRLFDGETVSHVLASVLKDEPTWDGLPGDVPARVRELLQRCLRKKAKNRLQSIGDARIAIEEVLASPRVPATPEPRSSVATAAEASAWKRALPWAIAAVAVAAGLGVALLRGPARAGKVVRFEIPSPESLTDVGSPRISPDGRMIAFNATDDKGVTQVWVRALDDLEAHPLAGTEGSTRPFWSPDSRYLGFVAGGKLKKVPIAGGPPQTLADTPTGSDGSWGTSGVILFDGQSSDPINRVSAAGGTPQPIVKTDPDKGIVQVAWPDFLPDGRHFLFIADGKKPEDRSVMLGSIDGGSPARKVAEVGSLAQYAPPGYLLYVREDSLLAQPFDPGSLRTTGEAVPLAEHIGPSSVGLADFSASNDGTLVFRSGWTVRRRLVWIDRSGKEIGDADQPAVYREMSLSPDGRTLAMTIEDPRSSNIDIWLRDLARGVTSRFTFDPARDSCPVFSPDGATIVFTSSRGEGAGDLYTKPTSGSGRAELLFRTGEAMLAQDWSRDGRWIALSRLGAKTGWDVWALGMSGPEKGKAMPVVQGPFLELRPSFSPDGRWIVYESNESGRFEVYVKPFPGPGGKWQVSTAGGTEASWSRDGKEIFYVSPGSKLVAVPVAAGATFTAGQPKPLFDVRLQPIQLRNRWVVNGDATRFLFLEPEGTTRALPTTVVLNWSETLRSR